MSNFIMGLIFGFVASYFVAELFAKYDKKSLDNVLKAPMEPWCETCSGKAIAVYYYEQKTAALFQCSWCKNCFVNEYPGHWTVSEFNKELP